MKSILVFVALCLWVFTGCEPKPNLATERENLLQADREFAALSARENAAEAIHQFLDSAAVQFSASRGPIHGRENIFKRMKPTAENYTLIWEPQFADVSHTADMGWTWGTYVATATADSSQTHGHYLNVWKKTADGSWRVVADIGNVIRE